MKGPGLSKMNCSILEEESYINDVTWKIPIWVGEGQKELEDNRTTWEWIKYKYNIRAHAIQYSKRRAKEKVTKKHFSKTNIHMLEKYRNQSLVMQMQISSM